MKNLLTQEEYNEKALNESLILLTIAGMALGSLYVLLYIAVSIALPVAAIYLAYRLIDHKIRLKEELRKSQNEEQMQRFRHELEEIRKKEEKLAPRIKVEKEAIRKKLNTMHPEDRKRVITKAKRNASITLDSYKK